MPRRPKSKPSMIGSWFRAPSKSSDVQPTSSPSIQNKAASSPPSPVEPSQVVSSEPLRKSVSLSIPRDATPVESRKGGTRETSRDARIDAVIPDDPGRDGRPSKEFSGTTSQAQVTRSTSVLPTTYTPFNASTDTLPEPLHDPFSGAPLGLLIPDHTQNPHAADPSMASKDEDLWNHLGRILELQSDIAAMHVQMEGLGARAKAKSQRETRALDQKASKRGNQHWNYADHGDAAGDDPGIGDRIVEDEGDEVAHDEEAERKKAREEEFARLGDRFTGRKDAIDEIMNKLDDLSQALTTFHTLQTPTIEFTNSRNNSNNQSNQSRPVQRSRTVPSSPQRRASASESAKSLPAPGPLVPSASVPPPSSPRSIGLTHLGQNPLILNAWVGGPKDLVTDSPISLKEDPMKDAS